MPATFRNNRPIALPGQTLQLDTPCGRLYVTVNRDLKSGKPVELLCRFGKAGTCGSAVMDGLTRMISFGLRAGVPPATVVQELGGIGCHRGTRSCMDALAQAIKETECNSPERVTT